MKRDIWVEKGGWYDTSFASDGKIYEQLSREVSVFQVLRTLGEHY